jgi:hypothetical protein
LRWKLEVEFVEQQGNVGAGFGMADQQQLAAVSGRNRNIHAGP